MHDKLRNINYEENDKDYNCYDDIIFGNYGTMYVTDLAACGGESSSFYHTLSNFTDRIAY